ncbi:hypothetical protein H0E84_15040 [Luteimonas sp. SJ-92]|uniref:Uncharacterized protein n=1 Tax=Luteimonas salinisoli TaxID=2752307 RepID=A0A853JFR8_9GAMM|nr:hypothetical protein [Luteimonas salinisoli]NZA27695.1 hypothetical protein [Luteimonas salinisoli]
MPTSTSRRKATPDEVESLRKLLTEAPNTLKRLMRGAGNALVLWAASLLFVVVAWLVVGWVLGKAFNLNLGLQSSTTVWLVAVATPVCAGIALLSSIRWVRSWPDYRSQLRDDLTRAEVNEERYVFSEAKRFQEPEHGGLIYFLRSTENEVFTVYDYESQELGVDDKDPLLSSYRPQTELLVVRAPSSGRVLKSQPSGAELSVGPPLELTAQPAEWPDAECPCPIPWDQLEQRL